MRRWSSAEGFAVPISKPRYTCRESAEMIDAPTSSARRIASADLPDAVGPQMTGTLLSAESPIEFIPGQANDARAAVDVVRRECSGEQRAKQRLHLVRRERL